MPRETLQTIEIPIPERLGSEYQGRAHAPFDPRLRANLWLPLRPPFHHPNLPLHERFEEIEVGEEIPGDVTTTLEISEPRGAGAARLTGAPRTLAWSWSIATGTTLNEINAISTPPIPWPFRIVGSTLELANIVLASDAQKTLQYFASDQDYTGPFTQIDAQPLIPYASGYANSNVTFGLRIRALTNEATNPQGSYNAHAQTVIGQTELDPGKRLTIAIRNNDTTDTTWIGAITVEEWAGSTQIVARPPSITRVTTTARAAAAAAPTVGRAPPYGSLTYWQNQVTINSRAPATPYKQQQLADAKAFVAYLSAQPARRAAAFVGQVSTAAQATEIATILRANGETKRAAIYADMARRMNAGLGLTPEQEAVLSNTSAYQPNISAIFVQKAPGERFTRLPAFR